MKIPITLRIYLVGLVQAALSVTAFALSIAYGMKAHPGLDEKFILQYIADETARSFATPEQAESRVTTVARGLYVRVRVTDAAGATVLEVLEPDVRACPEAPADGVVRARGVSCLVQHATFPGRGDVRIEVARGQFANLLEQLILMFAVIFAVGSLLLGRSLASPLRHMASVARAFGHGQTNARVALRRRDEVGDVAGAFDEMADHVVNLRRNERELLANVSHELRTPLARIRFALELADGDAAQWRTDIAEDLDELESMITDILTAARMELPGTPSGISPLRIEDVPVEELVNRAVARFRSAHPARPLEIAVDAPETSVQVDPAQVRRAIGNLLENAHKYSPVEDSPISLEVEAAKAQLSIRIVDRGIGIHAEDQQRLFQPFFRVEKSRSRTTGGLGLGLLLVRRIAEAHGGSARIESAPGQGTTATIELPRS